MQPLNHQTVDQLMNWLLSSAGPAPFNLTIDKPTAASGLFGQLFMKAPAFQLDIAKVTAFEILIQTQLEPAAGRELRYDCPYPKIDFLRYLTSRGYLIQGAKTLRSDPLKPLPQTDWQDLPMNAVIASSDGIWPLFFALLNRSALRGTLRDACFVVEVSPEQSERYYFFSVNQASLKPDLWSDGMIYILPQETFSPTTRGPVHMDEWASPKTVPIAAQLPVSPQDFPFLKHVTGHSEDEDLVTSWLQFKSRQLATSSQPGTTAG